MNAADEAIEEIRAVRRRVSAQFGHDISKYLAHLREEEKKHPEQIQRGKELLARRNAEQQKYPEKAADNLALREKPLPG
jgi:hypothetical protein